MTEPYEPTDVPEIITAEATCTLDELCLAHHVEVAWIADLVEHGAIDPIGGATADWRFDSLAIIRVARARRLQRDLSLDASGIALALELLDEIASLRARLKLLERPVSSPGEDDESSCAKLKEFPLAEVYQLIEHQSRCSRPPATAAPTS